MPTTPLRYNLFVGETYYDKKPPRIYIGRGGTGEKPGEWTEAKKGHYLKRFDDPVDLERYATEEARNIFESEAEIRRGPRRWSGLGDVVQNVEPPTFLFYISPWGGGSISGAARGMSAAEHPAPDEPDETVKLRQDENSTPVEVETGLDSFESSRRANSAFQYSRRRLRPHQARFRRKVLAAYGEKCAFCSIAISELLEAAHIVDFSLKDSTDEADNGLPLCMNHHGAFDLHIIRIDPDTLEVSCTNGAIGASVEVSELSAPYSSVSRLYLRMRSERLPIK